jgi:hypothetical protein
VTSKRGVSTVVFAKETLDRRTGFIGKDNSGNGGGSVTRRTIPRLSSSIGILTQRVVTSYWLHGPYNGCDRWFDQCVSEGQTGAIAHRS